jgi:hypothetical protein
MLFHIHVCHFNVHYIKSYISFLITVPFPGHLISPSLCQFIHCSCAYIPSCYPDVINTFPLLRSIAFSLPVPRPQFRFPNLFYSDILTACCPTPNLEGQTTVFINSGAEWRIYTSRHWVPILVAFYDLHGLQWGYSFPQSPHREACCLSVCTPRSNWLPQIGSVFSQLRMTPAIAATYWTPWYSGSAYMQSSPGNVSAVVRSVHVQEDRSYQPH